jgi:hypothetical protein
MRIVQWEVPGQGRRVGVVVDGRVRDITAVRPEWQRTIDVFHAAGEQDRTLSEVLGPLASKATETPYPLDDLLGARPGQDRPFLHAPLDHPDPHRVLLSGTGLTHTGSMQSRDEMHAATQEAAEAPKSDSRKMFEMGLSGGRPEPGKRGVAPEWFYKGNGTNLRGHRQVLEVPDFALDGGEEPELVGCYVIDRDGTPCRLGFALGNEWSDHATEKINYLYLAPSKLRVCSVGPELITDGDFQSISLRCTVRRQSTVIYDSGVLYSGERHMCHSLANCEDHHFKYPQHRQPGDVHLHFFGTSKLSYGTRDWVYQDEDEVTVEAPDFGAALVNSVRRNPRPEATPIRVVPG